MIPQPFLRFALFTMILAYPAESQNYGLENVPPIDSMASQWLPVSTLAQMPSLHNFNEMGACAPELLGVNYLPGGQLFSGAGPQFLTFNTWPLCTLLVNNTSYITDTCRWYPYQAARRRTITGLQIETTTRLVFEDQGILYQILVTNTGSTAATPQLTIKIPGTLTTSNQKSVVVWNSQMAHAFVQQPNSIAGAGNTMVAALWKPTIQPGQSDTIQMVMCHRQGSGEPTATALSWAGQFATPWQDAQSKWATRWLQAFTPGNSHFSGNAPVLATSDAKIKEIYYRAVLTLLVLERTNLAMLNRVFITSGERSKGTVFFWDTYLWSNLYAMLAPQELKSFVSLYLRTCNPHNDNVIYMTNGAGSGNPYSADDMAYFSLVHSYVTVTGDTAFLRQTVGGLTILGQLDRLATNWKTYANHRGFLTDYGGNNQLLECAPNYINYVPSFNATNVWMERKTADIYDLMGNPTRAAQMRAEADSIAKAVLSLYVPGGVWNCIHSDGTKVQLRHCLDFSLVGKSMTSDLTSRMDSEMVAFVKNELLTDHWMRAMSLSDPAAALSDRPDHGPMGAYDGWPAITAESMCLLGHWTDALNFLRNTQSALYEGVYAQARELYGPNRTSSSAPVRIASRGVCMRECAGGVAHAETVINTIFGYTAGIGPTLALANPGTPRGFNGTLLNVPFHDSLYTITSDNSGVHIGNKTVGPVLTKIDDTSSAISYSTGWSFSTSTQRYNSTSHYSNINGSYAQYAFTGTQICLISNRESNRGEAAIYIDGVLDTTIDLYSATAMYQQEVYLKTGLSNGQHVIKVVVTNQKNSLATDYYVEIDAFVVLEQPQTAVAGTVHPSFIGVQRMAKQFLGPVLTLPSGFSGKLNRIAVFDLSGKLLYRGVSRNVRIDTGIKYRGVMIAKILTQ